MAADVGVNLAENLVGNILLNQSAAFSDFHATGANPAANASPTDRGFRRQPLPRGRIAPTRLALLTWSNDRRYNGRRYTV